MSDIVERMRFLGSDPIAIPQPQVRVLLLLAADEILRLRQELHEAGDGDTWREACGRCEAEIARLREALKHSTEDRGNGRETS